MYFALQHCRSNSIAGRVLLLFGRALYFILFMDGLFFFVRYGSFVLTRRRKKHSFQHYIIIENWWFMSRARCTSFVCRYASLHHKSISLCVIYCLTLKFQFRAKNFQYSRTRWKCFYFYFTADMRRKFNEAFWWCSHKTTIRSSQKRQKRKGR